MRVLFDADQVRATVRRLGSELSEAYPRGVVMVAVLKGGVWFLADLIRTLGVPCQVDFLALSPYLAAPGNAAHEGARAWLVKDLDIDIARRDVVLIEDIVDTGLSLSYLLRELRRRGPASLEVCALLDRPARRIVPIDLKFRGQEVGGDFVVGYGLDFGERYRNLSCIMTVDPQTEVAGLDVQLEELFD